MNDAPAFPVIYSLDGSPSPDGAMLQVTATAFDGTVVPFAIPVDNVKHVVAFLLAWAGTIGGDEAAADAAPIGTGLMPIPATTIAIGQPSGEEGYIGISVGRAELLFSVPLASFAPLGRTLLMAGVDTKVAAS